MSDSEFTGGRVWVIGKWHGNVWLGHEIHATYAAADIAANGYGIDYTIEKMYELAGEDITPRHYWRERGIR
jgi:hypothetical protein